MTTKHVRSIAELKRVLAKDMRARQKRVERAVKKSARRGASVVRRNVPVAFSELRDSVHADGTTIVADAPHAAPVETGSRPHFPPIEPIERWVKLRGMQGLAGSSTKRLTGTTSRGAAGAVAGMIAGMESGGAVSVDAPRQIAFLIARAISQRGTKPHHYMRGSLPAIMKILDHEVRQALPEKAAK